MKKWNLKILVKPLIALIGGFLYFTLITSCTIPNPDEVNERVEESINGSLISPADIDPSGTNQFSFSVFGDVHIGSPLGSILSDAIDNIKSAGDAFVIIAGDLTDYAKTAQFDEFKNTFTNNNVEYRAAIGNHDVYFDGWDTYKSKIGPSVYSFDADNVHFVVLDSANGTLGEKQLDWLKRDLSSTSQTHKVIVTHYAPVTGVLMSFWRLSSDEESAVLKNIAYDYDVDIVIAAHFHGFFEKQIGNTKYIVTGGVNKLLEIGHSRNYVRITVNNDQISAQKILF